MADAKVIPFGDDPRTRRARPKSKDAAGPAKEPKGKRPPGRKGSPLAPVPEQQSEEPDVAVPAEAGSAPEGAKVREGVSAARTGGGWDRRIAGGLAFLRRRLTGDYEVDEFGYDEELTDKVLMSLIRPLYEKYFRVEVKGIENIPSEGGALIVANHSGTLPLDGLMLQAAVHDSHPAGRHLRLLAADLVFMLPVVNELARKAGHTLACAEDAEELLGRGELVGVMPEGFKGIGKPFGERYKLQRFGRGGFVSTALRAGAPIVPCSIVGAEEIYPMIGNAKTLARVLGIPYFPITPTFPWLGPLGAVPLPTKWTIQFGEPIPTDGYPAEAAEDPMLMFNLTDQVREQIQHTLYKLLVQRRSVFF
ncbi:lysophospholipid acyltransferase family protein [Streptomyces spiramyceticus]|uniref:lysophospholipid acyltransferase family protein n=1 Tax=Streptomyces spiramyceticus TaxID=299717 RepID=UPI00237A7C30|nr:lysophospholipid acyltransferase family protein [Streptomyces spiramyceticus]